MVQVALGIGLGYISAQGVVWLLSRQRWSENLSQDAIVVFCIALGLVVSAEKLPFYSGYLAVMALGFFLLELDRPLARRIRSGFDSLWVVAEIFLFVLLGAAIDLTILGNVLVIGTILLSMSTLLGRGLGWWLATQGSNWNWKERSFYCPPTRQRRPCRQLWEPFPSAMASKAGRRC